MENVEAMASCEISRGDNVKFECEGEEGECKETHVGYTLVCSGKRKEL